MFRNATEVFISPSVQGLKKHELEPSETLSVHPNPLHMAFLCLLFLSSLSLYLSLSFFSLVVSEPLCFFKILGSYEGFSLSMFSVSRLLS